MFPVSSVALGSMIKVSTGEVNFLGETNVMLQEVISQSGSGIVDQHSAHLMSHHITVPSVDAVKNSLFVLLEIHMVCNMIV